MTDTKTLNPKQLAFLVVRQQVETDMEAAEKSGITTRTVRRWKEDPLFLEEYQRTLSVTPLHSQVVERSLQESAQTELSKFVHRLGTVLDRMFLIAETAEAKTAVQAIKIIGDWFHLGEALPPEVKLTETQQKIKRWVIPGDSERNDGESDIEADFREVPD